MAFPSSIPHLQYSGPQEKYHLPWYFRLLRRFEDHRLDAATRLITPGESFLDIGCMNGELISKLAGKFKKYQGIDIVEKHVITARKNTQKLGLKAEFRVVDIDQEGLPFADQQFDCVTIISTLQFLKDPYFVISEIARALRPKGFLVIEIPNFAYCLRRLQLSFGQLPKTSDSKIGWDGGTLHYFTFKELQKLLKKYDFEITTKTGSGIFAKFRRFWPEMLCGDLIIKAKKIN